MSIFSKINKPDDMEESKDVIFKGGKEPLPTGLYPATVEMAILKESSGGAIGVELHLDIDGRGFREDIYLTNRNGDTFYTREKDGQDVNYPLPGYTTTNDLAIITTGYSIEDQETEVKTVELWDKEAEDKIPKEVDMLEDIRGKKIIVGIFLDNDFSQKNVGDASNPKWVDDFSKEFKRNSINKIFNEDGFTAGELINELEEPSFVEEWRESYTAEYVNDKTVAKKRKAEKAAKSGKKPGAAAKPGLGGNKPKTSMFSKKK